MAAQTRHDQNIAPARVLETTPAPSAEARAYFEAKLRCETDPSDVSADLERREDAFELVDTRSSEAFREGHLPGAINLPHRDIDERSLDALPAGKIDVTYCWGPGCNAGTKGALKLA